MNGENIMVYAYAYCLFVEEKKSKNFENKVCTYLFENSNIQLDLFAFQLGNFVLLEVVQNLFFVFKFISIPIYNCVKICNAIQNNKSNKL